MKFLLNASELIDHMEQKGIAFQIVNKEEAIHYLSENQYYLKLASYRENYKKFPDGPNKGKYMHLEFAYLKELAEIDQELRYEILQMCLDIEHFLKVKLLNEIEKNPDEDGYKIIFRSLLEKIKI